MVTKINQTVVEDIWRRTEGDARLPNTVLQNADQLVLCSVVIRCLRFSAALATLLDEHHGDVNDIAMLEKELPWIDGCIAHFPHFRNLPATDLIRSWIARSTMLHLIEEGRKNTANQCPGQL